MVLQICKHVRYSSAESFVKNRKPPTPLDTPPQPIQTRDSNTKLLKLFNWKSIAERESRCPIWTTGAQACGQLDAANKLMKSTHDTEEIINPKPRGQGP